MKEKKGNLLNQASGMFNVKSEIHAATRLSSSYPPKDFVICINILAIIHIETRISYVFTQLL